jgi:hypothetical protein
VKGIKPGTRAIIVQTVNAGPVALVDGCRGVVTDVILADITVDGREVFVYNFQPDNSPSAFAVPEEAAIPEDAREGLTLMLDNARRIRSDIEQIFIDVESWNDNSIARKNGAERIDPDPGGEMRRWALALDKNIKDLEGRLAR